jgi:trans-aconitate methyltransferase
MQTIAAQRDFYDARWTAKTFANRLQLERAVAILDGLQRTGLKAPLILDVGCGTGWLTTILQRFGPTTGIELSPAAIEAAGQKFPDVRFHAADVSVQLPVNACDVLVSHEVLEHMADQPAHVAAMARAIRPGGWLILTTPNAHLTKGRVTNDPQPIENHVTAKQLRSLLAPHFDIRDLRTIVGRSWRRQGLHLCVLAQTEDHPGCERWDDGVGPFHS